MWCLLRGGGPSRVGWGRARALLNPGSDLSRRRLWRLRSDGRTLLYSFRSERRDRVHDGCGVQFIRRPQRLAFVVLDGHLATGVLTAYSQGDSASSSIWETFTYTGLPAGGATITATLSLSGTLTESSDGFAMLEEGSQTDLNDVKTAFFNNATGELIPALISLSFIAVNGAPVIVFTEIEGVGDKSGGVANLGDPPTLSLDLPRGASVTTASGVFDNFVSATVPEPSTWAMVLVGFAALASPAIGGPASPSRSRSDRRNFTLALLRDWGRRNHRTRGQSPLISGINLAPIHVGMPAASALRGRPRSMRPQARRECR